MGSACVLVNTLLQVIVNKAIKGLLLIKIKLNNKSMRFSQKVTFMWVLHKRKKIIKAFLSHNLYYN